MIYSIVDCASWNRRIMQHPPHAHAFTYVRPRHTSVFLNRSRYIPHEMLVSVGSVLPVLIYLRSSAVIVTLSSDCPAAWVI